MVLLKPTTFSAYFFCFAFQCSLNLYFAQFSEINTTFVNCVMTEYRSTPKISRCSKIVELLALLSKTLVLLYEFRTRLYPHPTCPITRQIGASLFGLSSYISPTIGPTRFVRYFNRLIFKSPGYQPFMYFYKCDYLAFPSR